VASIFHAIPSSVAFAEMEQDQKRSSRPQLLPDEETGVVVVSLDEHLNYEPGSTK
jgi:hypothetical protein